MQKSVITSKFKVCSSVELDSNFLIIFLNLFDELSLICLTPFLYSAVTVSRSSLSTSSSHSNSPTERIKSLYSTVMYNMIIIIIYQWHYVNCYNIVTQRGLSLNNCGPVKTDKNNNHVKQFWIIYVNMRMKKK